MHTHLKNYILTYSQLSAQLAHFTYHRNRSQFYFHLVMDTSSLRVTLSGKRKSLEVLIMPQIYTKCFKKHPLHLFQWELPLYFFKGKRGALYDPKGNKHSSSVGKQSNRRKGFSIQSCIAISYVYGLLSFHDPKEFLIFKYHQMQATINKILKIIKVIKLLQLPVACFFLFNLDICHCTYVNSFSMM